MSVLSRFACAVVLLNICSMAVAQQPSSTAANAPAYLSDPKFVSAMAEGKTLLARRQPFAEDAFKKANKLPVDSVRRVSMVCIARR
jgi:hypothetical protein